MKVINQNDTPPKLSPLLAPYARVKLRKGSSGGQLSRTGRPVVPIPQLIYAGPWRVCAYQPATKRGPAPCGTYGGRKGKRIWPPWVCPARQSANGRESPPGQSNTSGACER